MVAYRQGVHAPRGEENKATAKEENKATAKEAHHSAIMKKHRLQRLFRKQIFSLY
jgi:hypothetical protein